MKNAAPYLRRTLFALLNSVVYNSSIIPVYEGEGDQGAPFQILIGEYSDSDKSNKNNFRGNASQVIEVVAEKGDATKKEVDAIGELVMALIKPTTRSEVLSGVDFQVMVIGKPSQNHKVEDSGAGTKIVRLILRYNLIVIER